MMWLWRASRKLIVKTEMLKSDRIDSPRKCRIKCIPDHFNRYVDEGKLPGYLILIVRRGLLPTG